MIFQFKFDGVLDFWVVEIKTHQNLSLDSEQIMFNTSWESPKGFYHSHIGELAPARPHPHHLECLLDKVKCKETSRGVVRDQMHQEARSPSLGVTR